MKPIHKHEVQKQAVNFELRNSDIKRFFTSYINKILSSNPGVSNITIPSSYVILADIRQQYIAAGWQVVVKVLDSERYMITFS